MQIAQDNATASSALGVALPEAANGGRGPYSEYKVIRRNGAVVGFEPAKISVAMTKAFLAVSGSQGAASARIRELVARLTEQVVGARRPLDLEGLKRLLESACAGLEGAAEPAPILEATLRDLYDGVPMEEVRK